MTTPVSIASNALLMLGDKPIASFLEESDRARLASNLWPQVRDSVLRSHPWNCAIKRVTLSPDETAPAFDWSYAFSLPGDFIKALSVGNMGAEGEFRIEGRKLIFWQLQRIVMEQALVAPLAFQYELVAAAQKVKGYKPNLLGKPKYEFISLQA